MAKLCGLRPALRPSPAGSTRRVALGSCNNAGNRHGPDERLLLIETPEFTTTPEKLLDVLTRIVADRSLGKVFFNDYYLMDVELLSDPSRRAIREQVAKRGMKLLMPALAPFHSNAWPWRTDPKDGTGPASLYEIWNGLRSR